MADFRAIGGVSATLQRLIHDRMELPDDAPVPVTIGPPRLGKADEHAKEEARVNIFLYRVAENGHLQNQEIPGRAASSGYGRPPLSLNLHYLVTAYGTEEKQQGHGTILDETRAHYLLGSAMRVLHDHPIVTDSLLTVREPAGIPVVHESVRGEYERIKLSLDPLSLEDVTKVWTALTLRYRLSAAYAVHVVQIESRGPRVFPRPVGEPRSPGRAPGPGEPGPAVDVITFRAPTITSLRVQRGPTLLSFPYSAVGDRLLIEGSSLVGAVTQVQIGELSVPAAVATSVRVEVDLPDDSLPDGTIIPPAQRLLPGAHTLSILVGDGAQRLRSNEAVFMLVPRVQTVSVQDRVLEVEGARLVGSGAGGATMIGRRAVPRSHYREATAERLLVPLPDSLPARNVVACIGNSIPESIKLPTSIGVTIGGGPGAPLSAKFLNNGEVQREGVPPLLQGAIRAAAPNDPRIAGLRVRLVGDRLAVIAGGLADVVHLAPTEAAALGFPAPSLPGAGLATLSGALDPFPVLSRNQVELAVQRGTAAPVVVSLDAPRTIEEAATRLQDALRSAGSEDAFTKAMALVFGSQLLVLPGEAVSIAFFGTENDATSVRELQLRARYAVRVRVAGAESIDTVEVELP